MNRVRTLRALRREIAKGLRDLDRGQSVVFDRALADSIKADGRRKIRGAQDTR